MVTTAIEILNIGTPFTLKNPSYYTMDAQSKVCILNTLAYLVIGQGYRKTEVQCSDGAISELLSGTRVYMVSWEAFDEQERGCRK